MVKTPPAPKMGTVKAMFRKMRKASRRWAKDDFVGVLALTAGFSFDLVFARGWLFDIPKSSNRTCRAAKLQQFGTLTAKPPRDVSLYFSLISRPVWRMVSIHASNGTK